MVVKEETKKPTRDIEETLFNGELGSNEEQ
jgi:hypothetical protein